MPKALLVSRDEDSAANLAAALDAGFQFEYAAAADAVRALVPAQPDFILLDAPLPDAGWLALCRTLRELSRTPIVVCSMSSREADVLQAFDAGADDYLVTPMRPAEMVARLRAVLRRTSHQNGRDGKGDVIVAGDVAIFVDRHEVQRKGEPVDLSPIEFRLLVALASQSGRAVSHSRLLASVWGPEYVDCRHYLRLYVRYLRSKLEEDPKVPELILNEWGVGYRFEPGAAQNYF